MASKSPEQRRKIRQLEAKRDTLTQRKKLAEEQLKMTRTQLRHARAQK